jgi:hypothetical protein
MSNFSAAMAKAFRISAAAAVCRHGLPKLMSNNVELLSCLCDHSHVINSK